VAEAWTNDAVKQEEDLATRALAITERWLSRSRTYRTRTKQSTIGLTMSSKPSRPTSLSSVDMG
jgi:hypothetical protein